MKIGACDGGGGGRGGGMLTPSSSDLQHLASQADGALNHPANGCRRNDINLTPWSPMTRMRVAGDWAAGVVNGDPGDGYGFLSGFESNDEGLNPHHLEALRPRKTRRVGPYLDGNDQHNNQNGEGRSSSGQGFLAVSPRSNGNSGGDGGFLGERGGYLNTAGVHAGPDEVLPTAPRRLVSRHHTPSRPERSGAKTMATSGVETETMAGRKGDTS